jgi:hypothetical protein
MSRDIAPFGVRMPHEMKEQLTDAAQRNRRSMNAELVARLEWSLRDESGFPTGWEGEGLVRSSAYDARMSAQEKRNREALGVGEEKGRHPNDIAAIMQAVESLPAAKRKALLALLS